MNSTAPAVEVLRDLLHRVLITENVTRTDRIALEEIDTAAGKLAARYRVSNPTATVMRCHLSELKELTMKVQATLANSNNWRSWGE